MNEINITADELAQLPHIDEAVLRVTPTLVLAITGEDKNKSREQVKKDRILKAKGLPRPRVVNKFTMYGEKHEATAIGELQLLIDSPIEVDLPLEKYEVKGRKYAMKADGKYLIKKGKGKVKDEYRYVEAKCPGQATKLNEEFHARHYAQIQFMLYLTGTKSLDYIVWREGEGITREIIKVDKEWQKKVIPMVEEFYDEVQDILNDREKLNGYLIKYGHNAVGDMEDAALVMNAWSELKQVDAEKAVLTKKAKHLKDVIYGMYKKTNSMSVTTEWNGLLFKFDPVFSLDKDELEARGYATKKQIAECSKESTRKSIKEVGGGK